MAELVIHCALQPGANAAEVAEDLETHLYGVDGVSSVLVKVEQPQMGLPEVLSILQITAAAVGLAEKLADYLKSRREKGKIRDVEVEIDGQRVPLGDLTPDQETKLAPGA